MNPSKTRNVVWAVDPFTDSIRLQREAGLALQSLIGEQNISVQPVYSTANPLPSLPRHFTRGVFESLQERAQTEFNRICVGLKLKILPLVVVKSEGKSIENSVSSLLTFSEKLGAQMIAVGTHAKSGPSRWFFGSFAETLSLKSKIPLLTVNPHGKIGTRYRTVFFPTDFSEASYSAFLNVIELAKNIGSRIHLYHRCNPFAAFNWDFPIQSAQVHTDWAREELQALETKASRWAREAISIGVHCTWEVDSKGNSFIADSIFQKSKRDADLLVMVSKSGPIEASLLGSITRQIMRGSKVPVMIIHPRQKKIRRTLKRNRKRPQLPKSVRPLSPGNDEHFIAAS